MMKTSLLSVLAGVLILPSPILLAREGDGGGSPDTVKLRISRGGLPFVKVAVQDTISGYFLLDTGAGFHSVAPSFLKRIHHAPRGRFVAIRHTGERVDVDMFQIPAITAGSRSDRTPVVGVVAALDSFGIDGILAASFFRERPATIDLRDSLLIFETEVSLARRKENGCLVPIAPSDIRGIALDPFVGFRVADSLELECLIDTGSPETVLDLRYASALGIRADQPGVERRHRKSLFGADEEELRARISLLTLGQAPGVSSREQKTVFKRNLIYDGIVGTDFWMGRALTLNIPGRYLLVGCRNTK